MKRLASRRLDLQAKISLVLVAVIIPTLLIVTVVENKFTLPILEEEIRQTGINTGKTLAARIDSGRLLTLPNPTPAIEDALQDILYNQPNILRLDVFSKDSATGQIKLVASNIEEDPNTTLLYTPGAKSDKVTSEYKESERDYGIWEIYVPIEHRSRDPKGPKKVLGSIHLLISTQIIDHIANTLWRVTASAAFFSIISLILALTYFLRKTIANDRLLKQAESQNLQLTEQLHDTQRQLMTTEKLAVMGQLTASFAHEIGTPLNAIGGHLQLLKEEIPVGLVPQVEERFGIVNGQLEKIASIVKSFLHSTTKPSVQRQLVDINRLADKTLGIVTPRVESLGVRVVRHYDREMGPVRAVPLDLEQILLNLLNNSLDSLKSKKESQSKRDMLQIQIQTKVIHFDSKPWAQLSIYDTGKGISKTDMKNVFKPFFSTKRPGEGTGLGLTICQQLAQKYGGDLLIDSKEGAWTRVIVRLPYHQGMS